MKKIMYLFLLLAGTIFTACEKDGEVKPSLLDQAQGGWVIEGVFDTEDNTSRAPADPHEGYLFQDRKITLGQAVPGENGEGYKLFGHVNGELKEATDTQLTYIMHGYSSDYEKTFTFHQGKLRVDNLERNFYMLYKRVDITSIVTE